MSKMRYSGRFASDLCTVQLEYRNKRMEIVSQKECSLGDYTELLKNGLIRFILEVEELTYKATDGKSKQEWPDDVAASFQKLRHKLLDMAGEVQRLSENLVIEVAQPQPLSPTVKPMRFTGGADGDMQSSPSWDFLNVLLDDKE